MKSVLQTEAAECGLACLSMVADHHGADFSMAEIRRRFSLSLKGAKLSDLLKIADGLGLEGRPLRIELEDIGSLRLPCILHWDLNHFVVLARVSRSSCVIFDPATGRKDLSLAEVSRHFTGVALELEPGPAFAKTPRRPQLSLRQLTGKVVGLRRALVEVLALSLVLQLLVLAAPFYLQLVIDQVLVSADGDLLLLLVLGFGAALVMQAALGLLRGWAIAYLASRLNVQWLGNVFSHLLRLPLDYFQKRHLGDIASRANSVRIIQRTISTGFVEAIVDGLMAVSLLAMMLVYSPRLAVLSLVAVGIYLAARYFSHGAIHDATERQLVAEARQQTYMFESIQGMQSLRLLGGLHLRQATYRNLLARSIDQDFRLARLVLNLDTTLMLTFGAERVAVICLGALLVMDNVFTVGMLVAYLAYREQFATRIGALIDTWAEFRMLRLHGERLADIVLTAPECDGEVLEASLPLEAGISIENVSFRYADGEPWVLRNCSFHVHAGECLALTGASGSGKTTLLKIMLGLLKPNEGSVRIGGREIHQYGIDNYRAHIGAVMQDDAVFAGSIADNIGFFESAVDEARVQAAAAQAAVHGDIVQMPMGYNTLIGDMGSALSGGQKQRLILARALYRRPGLLFLDEATSHLDAANERLVNEAIRALGVTTVVIAHRVETIAQADRVLLVEDGAVRAADPARDSMASARGESPGAGTKPGAGRPVFAGGDDVQLAVSP